MSVTVERADARPDAEGRAQVLNRPSGLLWAAVCAVLCVIFWEAVQEMIANYSRPDSYYSHGYLVPFVSLYFAWKQREALHRAAMKPSARGLWVIALCCVMVLLGDFLGFRIASQFALVFMLVGLVVALWGTAHAWLLWFPLAFLLFMIPIPISVTQALVLHVKILAIDCTVWLAQMLSLPMVRDGSYIAFGNDRLLVGEVCGGLRSLIALLALGAVIGYMSKARNWARFALFLLSAPVAILANVCRIFFLCVVGYVWGSSAATGRVHDISGLAIYAVAAVALSALELLLRRVAGKAVRPESGGAV